VIDSLRRATPGIVGPVTPTLTTTEALARIDDLEALGHLAEVWALHRAGYWIAATLSPEDARAWVRDLASPLRFGGVRPYVRALDFAVRRGSIPLHVTDRMDEWLPMGRPASTGGFVLAFEETYGVGAVERAL